MNRIARQKNEVRKELKSILATLSPQKKLEKSKVILEKLIVDPAFKTASKILIYASTADEPDTWPIIKNFKLYKKNFYLPSSSELKIGIIDGNSKLIKRSNNIYETEELIGENEFPVFDLIILPGLGFDVNLNRIGHGTGWYDKFLKTAKFKKIIGLCFVEQVLNNIPIGILDVKVHQLITD